MYKRQEVKLCEIQCFSILFRPEYGCIYAFSNFRPYVYSLENEIMLYCVTQIFQSCNLIIYTNFSLKSHFKVANVLKTQLKKIP